MRLVPLIEQLESRTMLSSGRGLMGYYFAGTDFTQVIFSREDPQFNFAWEAAPDASLGDNGFGVRWSGRILPRYSEVYSFYTRTTGGVRLWVNGQLIIDDWTTHELKDNKGQIALEAGVRTDIRAEYFDTRENSIAELHWASRRQQREVVPQMRFFASEPDTTPPTSVSKLRASYVTDRAMKWIWSPASDDSGTVVYDVYIGKTKLGATTENYFTRAGRVPETSYNVTVRSVDFAGNVTSSPILTITTLPPVSNGTGTGLAAKYFGSDDFTNFQLTRTDPFIQFPSKELPFDSANHDPLSAQWTGTLQAKYDELYTFTITVDGGMRLWINDDLRIDQWDHHGSGTHQFNMKLRAGGRYRITVEYRQSDTSPQPSISAVWSSLSTQPQLIPTSQLFPGFVDVSPPTRPENLRLESSTETQIVFRWDAAGDDIGVTRYDVYRNGLFVGSTADTSYTDDGLQGDSWYRYAVVAVDGVPLSSPPSSSLEVLTQPPAPRNAFASIPAINFNQDSGVVRSGSFITELDVGDWVKYSRIDFGSGANSVRIKLGVPVWNAGGVIELRIGSPNGTVIGRHVVQATGSYATQYVQQVAITGASGVHNLYMVFQGKTGVAYLESFQFSTQRLTRIMALGDSITASDPNHLSYRYYLWHRLQNAGYGAEFVGNLTNNKDGPAPNFDFDQNHEGHEGWRTDQILTHVASWISASRPEIVLIHVGTNDIWQGRTPASAVENIGRIIDAIRAFNPSIKILLAQIIPLAGYDAEIQELNSGLADLVVEKALMPSQLTLVDQYTGFAHGADLFDGVHLNADGESKMADRWYDALVDLMG